LLSDLNQFSVGKSENFLPRRVVQIDLESVDVVLEGKLKVKIAKSFSFWVNSHKLASLLVAAQVSDCFA
jgi:hypothetical protein